MRLWIRARRVPYLCSTLVLIGFLQVALGGRVLLSPTLVGTDAVSVWSMFLPVVVGIATADALAAKTQGVEQHVGTRVVLLDVALLLSIVAAASAVLAVLGGTHPVTAGTIGQVAIAAGAAAAVTLRWGEGPGALTPVALVVACFGYGSDAPARAYVRVLGPDSNPWWDLGVGVSVLCVAVLMVVARSARVQLRPSDRLVD
jgi:hypothetical protein